MANKNFLKLIISIAVIIILAVLGYFGYRFYNAYQNIHAVPSDAETQLKYGLATKKLLDAKPFIDKLPYTSTNFDIYYSTIDDEVQIIMKNPGLTFDQAKETNEANVNTFLQSIGVPASQKIVWLLSQ